MHLTRALALCVLALPGLAGCGTTYLLQAARGQWQVMAERRPIERVLSDAGTTETLRAQLESIQQARRFASQELGLPDNRSYTTYAEIGRPYVVWNVVATPEFSIQPLQWCFPVAGCVAYRGYFREAAARRFADRQRASGQDVTVGGVSAYSTLGRFADPVLSSMLRYGADEVDRHVCSTNSRTRCSMCRGTGLQRGLRHGGRVGGRPALAACTRSGDGGVRRLSAASFDPASSSLF